MIGRQEYQPKLFSTVDIDSLVPCYQWPPSMGKPKLKFDTENLKPQSPLFPV